MCVHLYVGMCIAAHDVQLKRGGRPRVKPRVLCSSRGGDALVLSQMRWYPMSCFLPLPSLPPYIVSYNGAILITPS
jgi:hypothetical protein